MTVTHCYGGRYEITDDVDFGPYYYGDNLITAWLKYKLDIFGTDDRSVLAIISKHVW